MLAMVKVSKEAKSCSLNNKLPLLLDKKDLLCRVFVRCSFHQMVWFGGGSGALNDDVAQTVTHVNSLGKEAVRNVSK